MQINKRSFWAYCLVNPSGSLVRDTFVKKKDLIDHYTYGAGPKSFAWKRMKQQGYKTQRVLVNPIYSPR